MAGSTTSEGRWQTGTYGSGSLKRRSATGRYAGRRSKGTPRRWARIRVGTTGLTSWPWLPRRRLRGAVEALGRLFPEKQEDSRVARGLGYNASERTFGG